MRDIRIPDQPEARIKPRLDQRPDLIKIEEGSEAPVSHSAPGREGRWVFDFRARLLLGPLKSRRRWLWPDHRKTPKKPPPFVSNKGTKINIWRQWVWPAMYPRTQNPAEEMVISRQEFLSSFKYAIWGIFHYVYYRSTHHWRWWCINHISFYI